MTDPRDPAKAPLLWSAIAFITVADIVTKYFAHTLLPPVHFPREIFGNTVRFTLVYNSGAAFGLHAGEYSRWIFITLTVAAVFVLSRLLRETRPDDQMRLMAIGLVLGGAFGNLINRLWSPRGVVDFLDVGVGDHRWPTFNVADIGVSIGAFVLAWVLWRAEQPTNGARRGTEERR